MTDDKVTILITGDNIRYLTNTRDLVYNGKSYYQDPEGLYKQMLESEKGKKHLFTKVSPLEASLYNWPTVDLSSKEQPFNEGIAQRNINVNSAVSNYMDKYNLNYKEAIDLYNTEILYAKLFDRYLEEYGNGNVLNPYTINFGNNDYGGMFSEEALRRSALASDWESHKNSYIDELATMWNKICIYKGDFKNGGGIDKSKKHVQDFFDYRLKERAREDLEILKNRLLKQAYIYDATKAREYRNMNEMTNSGLLVNDGYKKWMSQQDPTTPKGQARMDQLYGDATALYKPLSYIGNGALLVTAPYAYIGGMAGGYAGSAATDAIVNLTTDYDSWSDLAQKKFDMLPGDALASNPGMWLGVTLGGKVGNKVGPKVVNNAKGYALSKTIDKAVENTKLPDEYTIVQTLSSRRNPHLLYHTTPANISEAEMAGKPRGVRNQNKSWTDNFMGAVARKPNPTYFTLGELPHPGILVPYEGNENFGVFLGNGIELAAYLSGFGKNRIFGFGENHTSTVYKIPSGSYFNKTVDPITGEVTRGKALDFSSLDDIRVYSQSNPAIHNQIPGTSKIKLVGYTWSPEQTIDGATHPASFHPVFELKVAINQSNLPSNQNLGIDLNLKVSNDLITLFTNKGWNRVNKWFGDEFSKPVGDPSKRLFLTVRDLHSENIGLDLNGNTVITDPGINFSEPWKIGTKTSFPNRFNLNASDLDFSGSFPLKGTGRVDPNIMGAFRLQLINTLKAKIATNGTTPVASTSALPTTVTASTKPMTSLSTTREATNPFINNSEVLTGPGGKLRIDIRKLASLIRNGKLRINK